MWTPLQCTHLSRPCKKTTLFQRKLNELPGNVSFDSEFVLAFEIQPFRIAFLVFLLIFQSIPAMNGLSKSTALVKKQKIEVFQYFLLIFKRKR